MAEQEGGDSSNEEGDVAQTSERTIQYRENGQRQAEEGHQQLTEKAELLYADDGIV